MKMRRVFYSWILYFILGTTIASYGQKKEIKVDWKKEKIGPGLIWKSAHLDSLFGSAQHINVLEVNPKKRKLAIIYNPEENQLTSQRASQHGAIAAVNAGFFDIKNGGSVTYIKVAGTVLDKDTVGRWKPQANLNGALLVDHEGKTEVEYQRPNEQYDKNTKFQHILVTGPVLIDDGVYQTLNDSKFVQNRHPRTCACIRKKRILLITVDGRAEQAAGMSLPELKELLISLNCNEAINLDGGGSTTMWIEGKTASGVVNMPSDNKQFDHAGERKVSNIIAIF